MSDEHGESQSELRLGRLSRSQVFDVLCFVQIGFLTLSCSSWCLIDSMLP